MAKTANATAIALEELNVTCDRADELETLIKAARINNDAKLAANLQIKQGEVLKKLYDLWDVWNEEIRKARLSLLN